MGSFGKVTLRRNNWKGCGMWKYVTIKFSRQEPIITIAVVARRRYDTGTSRIRRMSVVLPTWVQ